MPKALYVLLPLIIAGSLAWADGGLSRGTATQNPAKPAEADTPAASDKAAPTPHDGSSMNSRQNNAGTQQRHWQPGTHKPIFAAVTPSQTTLDL